MTYSELETTTNDTFVLRALDKALKIQAPLAAAHVARLRRKSPGSSPQEILRRLNAHFTKVSVMTGVASGPLPLPRESEQESRFRCPDLSS